MTNDSQNKLSNKVNNDSLTPLAQAFLWVESESKLKLAIIVLASLCGVLFVLDFIIHRHSYAPNEGTPGFYALTGFLAFSFIVLGSGALRWFIARSEDFYSPDSVDAEEYPDEGTERLRHDEGTSTSSGKNTGKNTGKTTGKTTGKNTGKNTDKNTDKSTGNSTGKTKGKSTGNSTGKTKGKSKRKGKRKGPNAGSGGRKK